VSKLSYIIRIYMFGLSEDQMFHFKNVFSYTIACIQIMYKVHISKIYIAYKNYLIKTVLDNRVIYIVK